MNREDKKHIIITFAIAAITLVLGIYAMRKAKADFARQIAAEVQEAQSGQQARTGPVTIHTTDGETWGYYGNLNIIINDDGSTEVVLNDAWLVGTTDEDFH